MMTLNLEKENVKDKPRLVFRCERTAWVGSKGDINFRVRYWPLKNKSTGDSWAMEDDLHETLVCHNYAYDSTDPIIHKGKHGKLYEVVYTNISTDWETGYVDGYDLELREYEEDKSVE